MRATARRTAAVAALCAGCAEFPWAAQPRRPEPTVAALIPADVPAPSPAFSDDVDFAALREAYGARVDFGDRCEVQEIAQQGSAALVAQRFQEVLDVTGPALARCPVWPQLHLWRAAALRSLGRDAEAATHRRWFLGLTQSILDSGDGRTPGTAYVTISTSEEYALLVRLHLQPQEQYLVDGPPMVDLVEAVDESGMHVGVYFDPKWHFVRLQREAAPQR